ncbi:discoidin domain-containing protein [Streptosporangium sp. NBC_01756]|uniref:discoidin domain-containing protein n=1 Tax=Streptosporangium sp. NBC_01756 TaxID=2975950 RepID=UPI002DD91597|nr:discoidin domain-containing protein [Streptosporangium sp. NBC_01756]WSC88704.1 discoidin domain-containing protein [Streptosporangium sp. NBC_01756]
MHSSRSPGRHRLILLVAAAATLVLSLFTVPAAMAADTLLSAGRPVTASSAENVAFPATAAVDGNPGTRWSSAFSDPQWIQVDLGAVAGVTRVVLNWETAYGTAFQIQVSANGSDWTPIHSTTTGTGGTQTLDVSGSGRYVRMYGTQRSTQYGYSLWEFQVYGTIGGTPTPTPTPTPTVTNPPGEKLLSYGRQGVASTSQSDGNCWECTPARAFDRDPASRWATSSTTGWVDPGWIYVDLGATAQISKVVLQWDPAYAKAFQIQVSPDAANWTSIYSTTTGTGFKQTLNVTGTGRYVRMYGTQRGTPYGYSLWEFQVYGTGGAPITPPPLPPDPAVPPRLVWSDEFNGAAGTRPDAAKWKPEIGPGVNNELQYYTNNDNASTDGAGNLVMEARRQATPGSACPPDPLSGGSTTCQYTSSRLNTYGKFSFTYGRVEARIKPSGTKGIWPAFWLLGADFFDQGRPWPYVGEIDIMEHIGKEPHNVYSTIHAPAYFGAGGFGKAYTIPGNFNDAFHVFAVDWNSKGMRFTVDGNLIHEVDRATLEATRGPWVFDHPFFIILNNAVGGDWPGPPDASTVFPQKMLVDYVRVYQ